MEFLEQATEIVQVCDVNRYATPSLASESSSAKHSSVCSDVTNQGYSRIQIEPSQCLNKYLLPGPILGPSLLGELLHFRQHVVVISGDIKSMFHQILVLPLARPLLHFLWRDMNKDVSPTVYQWQVCPFSTTCSPCCATYALQQRV